MLFSSITHNINNDRYFHFYNCSKLSTIHLIWPDNAGGSNKEIDLRLLLPDYYDSKSTKVYKQINYIDLRMPNGNNPTGKALKISYCGLNEESITLNTSNGWTWKYVPQ
jgi:hypothetical protein